MDLSYRQRIGKAVTYMIIISLAALIQNTDGLTLEIGGARCFLLLPVCMIIGIGEDEFWAGMLGLFGGMLWDLTAARHHGFNAVFICLFCFFCAALITYYVRATFLTGFIFSAAEIFAYCLLYWLFFIIFKNMQGSELTLFSFYIPSAIYTIAVTPIVWLCISPVKKALNRPAVPAIKK